MRGALTGLVVLCMAAGALSGCGGSSCESESEPADVQVQVGIPLSSEQAALLEGVRQKDGVAADVFWDGSLIARDVPISAPSTIRPTVRSLGRPEPSPGALARRVRRQESSSYGVDLTFALPEDLLKSGSHNLETQLHPASGPDTPLLQIKVGLEVEPGPEKGTTQVAERSVASSDVVSPDPDGDGVSTLTEVAVVLQNRAPEEAFAAAESPEQKPTTEETSKTVQTLQAVLPSPTTSTPTTADTTPPETTITASPSNPTHSTTVTFAFSSSEAGSTFQCSFDGSAFQTCVSPVSGTVPTNGSHTFQVKTIDPAGNADPTPASFTWTIDTAAPTSVSLKINDGATYANSTSVTLTLSATGATQMAFSNDGSTYSDFETYATTKSWALTSGDGGKMVYATFVDSGGSVSSAVSAQITLDSTASAGVSVIDGQGNDMDQWPDRTHLMANWSSSSDSGSGLDRYEYAIGTSDCSGSSPNSVKGFTSTGSTTSFDATGLNLSAGVMYYANVKTFDKAGNSRCDSSDGVTVQ